MCKLDPVLRINERFTPVLRFNEYFTTCFEIL